MQGRRVAAATFNSTPPRLCLNRGGELKPRSRWSGIRTSPIRGDGRIQTELAPLGRGDQALLGSTFVSQLLGLLMDYFF